MATIEMWSIKYMTLVAGWLLLSPICHLHQDYHNRILLGMRQRMRGSQLDGFLQAWTNFPPSTNDSTQFQAKTRTIAKLTFVTTNTTGQFVSAMENGAHERSYSCCTANPSNGFGSPQTRQTINTATVFQKGFSHFLKYKCSW